MVLTNLLTMLTLALSALTLPAAALLSEPPASEAPLASTDADRVVLRLLVQNSAEAYPATLRITDASGSNLHVRTLVVARASETVVDVRVLPGEYTLELRGPGITGVAHARPDACPSGVGGAVMRTSVAGATTLGMRVTGDQCFTP